jgi:hypothetical protein
MTSDQKTHIGLKVKKDHSNILSLLRFFNRATSMHSNPSIRTSVPNPTHTAAVYMPSRLRHLLPSSDGSTSGHMHYSESVTDCGTFMLNTLSSLYIKLPTAPSPYTYPVHHSTRVVRCPSTDMEGPMLHRAVRTTPTQEPETVHAAVWCPCSRSCLSIYRPITT